MAKNWTTTASVPSLNLEYQMGWEDGQEVARVLSQGHEVVSPTTETGTAWRQFNARYKRAMAELEEGPQMTGERA